MAKMNRADKRRQSKLSAKTGRREGPPPLPPEMQSLINLAVHMLNQGKPVDALAQVERILHDLPKHPHPLCLKGFLLHQCGQPAQAVNILKKVVKQAPGYIDAHIYLGNALQDLDKPDEAAKAYQRALSRNAEAHEARLNLANALFAMQAYDDAADHFGKIPHTHALYPLALERHGDALKRLERFEDARACYEELARLQPNSPGAHLKLGVAQEQCGDMDSALSSFHTTLKLDPDNPGAHFNMGNHYIRQIELDAAARCFETAIANRPDQLDWYCNLGMTYQDMGRLDDAMATFNKALELDPRHQHARNNVGILQLLRGDFEHGWGNWNARSTAHDSRRQFSAPFWQGEDLTGKHLAITCEQGVGDQILYATILHDFDTSKTALLMECDERLIPLFERSFGTDITFIAKRTPPDARLNAKDLDVRIPLGSLGQYLRQNRDSFKNRSAFLRADPLYAETLRKRYHAWSDGKPVVGISWYSGNEQLKNRKSMELELWQPILNNPNYRFLSLQYGDVQDELKAYKDKTGIDILFDPEVDALKDMDGFTAQVDAVDFVITISNATAHVAGAIGKETWLMLSFIPVWCWQLEGSESLWYDSIRMYRQADAGDWSPVIANVNADLAKRSL